MNTLCRLNQHTRCTINLGEDGALFQRESTVFRACTPSVLRVLSLTCCVSDRTFSAGFGSLIWRREHHRRLGLGGGVQGGEG